MPRLGRSFLAAEFSGALVMVVLAVGTGALQVTILEIGLIGVALLLLSVFDVWLPHGDSVDIAQALAIGVAFVIGAVPAMGVVCFARVIAHVLRYRLDRSDQLLHLLSRRIIALGAAGLAHAWLAGWAPMRGVTIVAHIVAAAVAVLADAVLLQAYAASRHRQSMVRLFAGGLRLQGLMWGAYVSVSALTAILFPDMGVWGLLLMSGLLVVMRQSFSLLLDIRGAYSATMAALAAAVEAHDSRRQGHANRVAALARAIGIELGLHGRDLERLGYAALLHDVDLIGMAEGEEPVPGSRPSELLGGVKFLADVVPVLALCDGGGSREDATERDRLLAYIVCRASNLDDLIKHEAAAVRIYSRDAVGAILSPDEREPVERAVWRLLAPGARLSA